MFCYLARSKHIYLLTYLTTACAKTTQILCASSTGVEYVMRHCFIFCTECPDDFTYVPAVKGCYRVLEYKLMWIHAGPVCQSYHSQSHLVIVNNAAEQEAIKAVINGTDR